MGEREGEMGERGNAWKNTDKVKVDHQSTQKADRPGYLLPFPGRLWTSTSYKPAFPDSWPTSLSLEFFLSSLGLRCGFLSETET